MSGSVKEAKNFENVRPEHVSANAKTNCYSGLSTDSAAFENHNEVIIFQF